MNAMGVLACIVAFATAPVAQASIVSVNPTNSGHCIYSASVCFGDSNVGAAALDGGASGTRHFMLFDLSGLSGSVTSARLEIDAGQYAYDTFSSSQQYVVTNLSVDRALITSRTTGPDARLVYAAIATGTLLGSTTVLTPMNDYQPHSMPAVSVDLGGDLVGITAALGGEVALGGYTLGGMLFYPWLSGNGPTGTRLVLDVNPSDGSVLPTPGSLPLVAVGLFSVVLLRRNRKVLSPTPPNRHSQD